MTTAQLVAKASVCLSCAFARGQPFFDLGSSEGSPSCMRAGSFGQSDLGILGFPKARRKAGQMLSIRNDAVRGMEKQGKAKSSSDRARTGSHELASERVLQQKTGKSTDFMRFADMGEAGTELQTAIVTYSKEGGWWEGLVGKGPIEVDLVACVHIADKSYYQGLQKEFEGYDRVLYEMVTDKAAEQLIESIDKPVERSAPSLETTLRQYHAALEKGLKLHDLAGMELGKRALQYGIVTKKQIERARRRQKKSWKVMIVGQLQKSMAWALNLDFQLAEMDYSPRHWRNADMDYNEFLKMQKERKEGLFSFAKTISAASRKMPWGSLPEGISAWKSRLLMAARFLPMPLVGLLLIEGVCSPENERLGGTPEVKALLDLDLAAAMKVTLARQLSKDLFEQFEDASDDVRSSVIIGERNAVALKELKRAIAEGDRRIAIFYGSAHLPDIEDRLLTEFGLTKTNTQWRTAWRMTKRRSLPLSGIDPLEKFLTELRALSNWPLNRSQTVAMLLISLALATDLYFWELMIDFADNKLGELLPVLNLWVPMLLDKMASVRL